MKITIKELKSLIAEEVDAFLEEADEGEQIMQAIGDVPKAAEQIADKIKREIETLAEPSGLEPQVLAQAVAALLTAD
tara:strand:- start:656 stop:886 length:231 start_codon:yes stop_codon:yes gene_type:complete